MRRAAKIDANQQQIVSVARAYGATVQSLATVGNGCPDLLIGYKGHTILVEVKDGSKPLSQRLLNEQQCIWWSNWRGGTLTLIKDVQGMENLLRTIDGSTTQGS